MVYYYLVDNYSSVNLVIFVDSYITVLVIYFVRQEIGVLEQLNNGP